MFLNVFENSLERQNKGYNLKAQSIYYFLLEIENM